MNFCCVLAVCVTAVHERKVFEMLRETSSSDTEALLSILFLKNTQVDKSNLGKVQSPVCAAQQPVKFNAK